MHMSMLLQFIVRIKADRQADRTADSRIFCMCSVGPAMS